MNREPLWTVASIAAVLSMGVALIVAVNDSITQDQTTMVLGVAAVVAPLVVAAFARGSVTPLSSPRTEEDVPLVPARPAE